MSNIIDGFPMQWAHVVPAENEKDESDILANQDETDPGDINEDDDKMGGSPAPGFAAADVEDFVEGDVDVKEQMDRAARAYDFPNRSSHPRAQD